MRRSGFLPAILLLVQLFLVGAFSGSAAAQVACPDASDNSAITAFTPSIKARPTDGQCLFQGGSSGMVFSANHSFGQTYFVIRVVDYNVNLTSFACTSQYFSSFSGNTWESRVAVIDGPTTCTFAGLDSGGNPFSGQLTARGYDSGGLAYAEITNMSLSGVGSVFAGAASGTQAADLISEFLGGRATALLAAQPDLLGLLDGADPTFGVMSTKGQGHLSLRSGGGGPVWVAAEGSWGNIGTAATSYTLLSFGAHARLGNDMILGGMVEFDRAMHRDGTARVDGNGYLVGPYFASRGQVLSIDARLLYGLSANRISLTGASTDSFTTQRWLADFNLSGEFTSGVVKFLPGLGFAYAQDNQQAYVNSLAVAVPAQTARVGELTARMNWQVPLADGRSRITGGVAGILGWQSGSSAVFDGARGRVDLGFDRRHGLFGYKVNVWVDGIGRAGLLQRGFEAKLDWAF